MPKAPANYQFRYPIDFGDIDANVRQQVVQLYAADGGKSKGILYQPPTGKPRTVVIMAHPRADFAHHYSIPFWVERGFAAFGQNTRYLNNDATMLHEAILVDRTDEHLGEARCLGTSLGQIGQPADWLRARALTEPLRQRRSDRAKRGRTSLCQPVNRLALERRLTACSLTKN